MTAWTVGWARISAMLLLAAICADVANVHCDEASLPAGDANLAVSAPEADSADSCATVCVPDCFCCTRTEQARVVEWLPQREFVALQPVDACLRPAAGTIPLPYHPPLNLL